MSSDTDDPFGPIIPEKKPKIVQNDSAWRMPDDPNSLTKEIISETNSDELKATENSPFGTVPFIICYTPDFNTFIGKYFVESNSYESVSMTHLLDSSDSENDNTVKEEDVIDEGDNLISEESLCCSMDDKNMSLNVYNLNVTPFGATKTSIDATTALYIDKLLSSGWTGYYVQNESSNLAFLHGSYDLKDIGASKINKCSFIDNGSFGAVYKASIVSNVEFAVKTIDLKSKHLDIDNALKLTQRETMQEVLRAHNEQKRYLYKLMKENANENENYHNSFCVAEYSFYITHISEIDSTLEKSFTSKFKEKCGTELFCTDLYTDFFRLTNHLELIMRTAFLGDYGFDSNSVKHIFGNITAYIIAFKHTSHIIKRIVSVWNKMKLEEEILQCIDKSKGPLDGCDYDIQIPLCSFININIQENTVHLNLVMRLFETSLKNQINKQMTTEKDIIDRICASMIFSTIAFQLHELHKFCCMHRDVKPSNVIGNLEDYHFRICRCKGGKTFYSQTRREMMKPNVIDFSVARKIQQFSSNQLSTTITEGVGEKFYVAPESNSFEVQSYNEKADVFSLGVCYYEYLETFQDINNRNYKLEQLHNRINSGLPPLTKRFLNTYTEEGELLSRMLSKDPDCRPSIIECYDQFQKFTLILERDPFIVTDDISLSSYNDNDDSGEDVNHSITEFAYFSTCGIVMVDATLVSDLSIFNKFWSIVDGMFKVKKSANSALQPSDLQMLKNLLEEEKNPMVYNWKNADEYTYFMYV